MSQLLAHEDPVDLGFELRRIHQHISLRSEAPLRPGRSHAHRGLQVVFLNLLLSHFESFLKRAIFDSRKLQDKSRVDSIRLDLYVNRGKVCDFYEEEFRNEVRNSCEEFDLNLNFFLSKNLSLSRVDFDDPRASQRAQTYVEIEGNFARVFYQELRDYKFVERNFSKVNEVCGKFVVDMRRVAEYFDFIFRPALHYTNSCGFDALTSLCVE